VGGVGITVPDLPGRRERFRPSPSGILARTLVAVAIPFAVVGVTAASDNVWADRISLAAIYAIIGLSVNVLIGYAGQISLGHQAFVGIGAFMSAFVAARIGAGGFAVGVPAAGITGAVMALGLGVVALRIRGLYLALITLAFGRMAETTIFNWKDFTGGGAGAPAPRPAVFASDKAYAFICLMALAVALFVDWRLSKTRGGRAMVAFRNDERKAATLGVNVTAYKLLAFAISGFMAGVGGALFAHRTTFVSAVTFNLTLAIVFVLMAVVGGLGSRAGVTIGSAFFAIFPFLVPGRPVELPFLGVRSLQILTPLIGAFLLLMTVTLNPGGIGQQLLPIRRWLAGDRFFIGERRQREHDASEPQPMEPDDSAPPLQLDLRAEDRAAEPVGRAVKAFGLRRREG
jgi:branched-chain amino acid transport system permease protein